MRFRPAPIMALLSISAASVLAAPSSAGQSPATNLAPAQQVALTMVVGGQVSPDKCQTSGGVKVLPCKLTFTQANYESSATVSGPGVVRSKVKGCAGIVTFSYFDYGIWYITSTQTAGKCSAVFTGFDAQKHKVGTATLKITSSF
jgi:hypothetical protein